MEWNEERANPIYDAQSVMASIPRGVVIVQYGMLEKKLLIWVIRGEGLDGFEQTIEASQVEDQVAALRKFLSDKPVSRAEAEFREREVRARGADLYRMLISPIEERGWLSGARTIFVVPDGPLSSLPFAALRSPGSERHRSAKASISTR